LPRRQMEVKCGSYISEGLVATKPLHHIARPPLPRSQAVYNHQREVVRILRRPGRRDNGSAKRELDGRTPCKGLVHSQDRS
jgi:hypothetical protein